MRIVLFLLLVLAGNLTSWDNLEARPGGGHSSSSSSSSSSHSSSGFSAGGGSSFGGGGYSSGSSQPMTAGETLFFFILIVVLIALYVWYNYYLKGQPAFTPAPTFQNRTSSHHNYQQQLALLKQADGNFSAILLLEFIHSLYTRFYSYATHPEFSYLSPFLSAELQQHFKNSPPWLISEVVVNGINWQNINSTDLTNDSISVDIDANYTLQLQGKRSRYAVQERWLLLRQKGLLSAEPQKMHALSCPQCGAPAHFTDAGVCGHCGTTITPGDKQWYVAKRVVLSTQAVSSDDLVSYAAEQGTELATIKAQDLMAKMQTFQQQHGVVAWEAFWQPFEQEVVRAYFTRIYQAWSQRNWQTVRHLLSDRIYETNNFWINLYQEHNWFNRLDNLSIQRVELVKIELDKFYEAITVRIFAACNDYTEDANGKVIGGAKRDLRRYSEYWTLVRRTGMQGHSAPYSLTQCPKCGAPADNMGQTGECGYCGAKISTGDFSWVVFLITQDEVYAG